MKLLLADISGFLRALFRNWKVLLTSSILPAVLLVAQALGLTVPTWLILVGVLVAFAIAVFNVWRAEKGRSAQLDHELSRLRRASPPNPEIQRARRAIYDGLCQVRENILRDAYPQPNDIPLLHKLRQESLLVCDDGMAAFISEWIEHAAALATARSVLARPDSPDRKTWVEKSHAALLFFSNQFDSLTLRFRPFIGT